jgi:hypothetical protein
VDDVERWDNYEWERMGSHLLAVPRKKKAKPVYTEYLAIVLHP